MNEKVEKLEMRLAMLFGAQAAMFSALKVLMAERKGDPKAIATMGVLLELSRAELSNSPASEVEIEAFDHVAQMLKDQLA